MGAGQVWTEVALSAVERWWEPGLVGGGAGRGLPDWAAFAEAAAARAPEQPLAPEGDFPGLSGFEWVLRPFTRGAGERLERGVSARARRLVDLAAVRDDLERHLSGRLARAAARTLVLELYEARSAGRLDGDDTRARFRDFLGRTASRGGLAALLAGRPVLARILGRAALDAADALAEALERLADDRARLTAGLLGGDPGLLVSVAPGAGDGHRGGRSVMLLRFADGTRLVYKPRPLAVHRHFNDLVGWFNGLPHSADLRTLRLLDRGGYGWVEFVAAGPCATTAEIEVFYRRQGALLALLHLIDGTDLHHENLIAVGAHPVLIDVETLFHPPLAATATEDPAARALHDSVYRVGLLPQLMVGDDSALDVSAVGGGREAVSPVARATWADAGTDRMRLVRRAGTFGESANRPRLADGTPVEPAAHVDALCAGFRTAYAAIAEARGELLHGTTLLRAFADDEVRVLARPTWVYSTMLDESTHPDLLKDAAERQRALETLRTDDSGAALTPDLVDEEIAQLWAGDVPLFTARPGTDRLWGVPERPLAGRADRSGIARVAARLAALDTVDRQDQEWIVRAAMATASCAPVHRPVGERRARTAERAPEPERLLSAARSVGDRLVSLAYRRGPRTNWIGLELLDERYWRIGAMPADLAGGYTGPALFLAQLAALTGADHYAEVARTALAPVPGLLDALRARPTDLGAVGSGAFSGLGGIAYALAETARLLDDPEVGSWAAAMLRLAGTAARSEPEHGVAAGVAGGLAALLAAHRAGAGGPETWRDAQAAADRLAAADPTAGGRGFTTGAAGRGWALLRFAEAAAGSGSGAAGGAERYRFAGLAALRAAVDGEPAGGRGPVGHGGAPADASGPSASGARASAWCRGRAGIALAVLDAPHTLADQALATWARGTVEALGRDLPAADDSLCHGEAGVCELLGHGAAPEARAHWIRRVGALLASVEETGSRSGAPDGVAHPGLLTGLAGIGHGLLRAGFPERVPSLLLLHTSG
ncbi:type 2 lanthipeptide synthetase LanM family protein [Streptomyces lavendulae]|uniref:type 2 lanthipeptide synthetase LanM family protein n=1 Tax=Streptomyces lavendulae TaxID=1914 RepID=UPI0024A5ECDB|nr:type 2 lanthipeptide synthetase LanM family protein [Streptomyces lavendulae]GLX16525.1 lanthionine synthetase [Streptomyces lavendulae subsp. lavendulae]GLX25145.1 lanthionine synthetase [Streptomyces lavendulae subsp. lavendulae]